MTFRNDIPRDLYPEPDKYILALAERLEDPRQILISFNSDASAATGSGAFSPGQKIRIISIILNNGDVDIESSTNTTVLDIDVFDAPGTGKTHDVATKLVGVVIDGKESLELTLSTDEDDLIVEADETLQVIRTIANAQGEMSLTVSYRFVD